MEDRTEDRAFELLKKLVKNVQLSSKKILILITGIVISAFITFIRPQIVSTLTDAGLAKKNFMNIVFWCAILLICAVFEYGNGLLQIKIFVKMNNQFVEDMYPMALISRNLAQEQKKKHRKTRKAVLLWKKLPWKMRLRWKVF